MAGICAVGIVVLVWVATPSDAELLEEVPSPPKIIEGQPIDQPTISKRKDGDNEVEEYSVNGNVYMVKVTPPSGKPYYLHREDRNGDWVNDGPTRPLSVPKWTLFRF
jgi:hypothetical protein